MRSDSQPQSIPNTGARATMKKALSDWNQLAGISQLKNVRSVRRSANRLSEEPACSNPDQNRAAPTKNTKMAPTFFFSS